MTDIVVIGGGIAGLSAAAALSEIGDVTHHVWQCARRVRGN